MLFGMVLASGLGDRIGIIPMIELDAGFNILAGVLAFFMIHRRNISVAEPEARAVAQNEAVERDAVML